ncbi:MAG: signal peptide peptidase SppA [Flavobacteriales bacterium TMED191]|nr:MAG: signal peptide peptidase SppA [Flavobacteriales bacterium TMED191]
MSKTFLQNILSSALGFITGFAILISAIFILLIFSTLISTIFNSDNKLEPNSILKIQFDTPIYDKPNNNPFKNFNPINTLGPNKSIHLYKLLNAIDIAANDKNIKGIVLDMDNYISPGSASSKEIRDALEEFKQTDKFIYAYSTIYSQSAYYIASVSDSVFMYPKGMVTLRGLSSTTPFFKNTLEEIGIKPEVIRHGKFKAAVEPFMEDKMSPENRLQTKTLLEDVWSTMTFDISENRNLTKAVLNDIADSMTMTMPAKANVELGLIDSLIYPDHFKQFIANKINENTEDLEFLSIDRLKNKKNKSKNKIAIIYAEGGIDGDTENIHVGYTKTIKKAFEDDEVKAIVLRVNSPGGSALISDEILSQIKLSKKDKPLVVSMGNVAASGGYYISCAADKILASPTTITGSIGVFGLFFTAEELLTKKIKLSYDNVKTNSFANLGEIHRSLSKKEKDLIQRSVKNTYQDFIQHVSDGRNMSTLEVDKIGQGRVWTGLSSIRNGLVDSLGGLKDAINIASQLANLNDFKTIELPRNQNGLESFLENIETFYVFHFSDIKKEELYLNELRNKYLKMQGIQALLITEYNLE